MFLFLVGTGQTGKSTFSKMLTAMLKQTCCPIELNRLGGQFETSRIPGKKLIIFGNVAPNALTPKRATLTKLATSNEAITVEPKGKKAISIIYNGTMLGHGNLPFNNFGEDLKDATGLARRILYFNCDQVPLIPNPRLPEVLEKNLVRIM